MEANAKLEGVSQVTRLGGPALGGQIIAWLSAPMSLLVTSVGLAASTLFVTGIRRREPAAVRQPGTRLRADIAEGLRYVFGNRLLRSMAAATCGFNLCVSAYTAMQVVFLARTLELSAATIGLMFSIAGVGGLLGALAARRVAAVLGQGPTMWAVQFLGAPATLVLPLIDADWRIWLAAAASSLLSFSIVVYNVTHVSGRQVMTPDHLLGRMNATMRTLNWTSIPLGALLGGVLGGWLGPRETLLIASLSLVLVPVPLLMSPLRSMRELPVAADAAVGVSGAGR